MLRQIVSRHPIILVLALALALRLVLWGQPLHEPANDETEYVTVAYDLLAGRGWQFYTHYHWLRAPLYPLVLAGSLWLTNGDLHLAALPMILLSVATVALVYALTRELVVARNSATPYTTHYAPLLAALFATLLFTFNTFASLYMSETLFTFLFTTAILVLVRWHKQATNKTAVRMLRMVVVAGVFYGLATLTRSVSLAFLPVVVLWMLYDGLKSHGVALTPFPKGEGGEDENSPSPACGGKGQGDRVGRQMRTQHLWRIVLPPLLFTVSVLLTIAPWTIRNCQAYGRCILVETGLSYNLWAFSEPHEDMGKIFRVLENIPNPAERADEATRRGRERLQADPAILLRKLYPNWVALWRVKPIQDRFLLPNYYTDPPPLVFLGALVLDDMLYVVVLVAGVLGLYAALLAHHTRGATLLLGMWVLYIVTTTLLTHGEGRYRHFVFPVLLPYAAWGITGGWRWWLPAPSPVARPLFPLRLMSHVTVVVLCLVLVQTIWRFYPWQWAIGGAERSIHRLVGDTALAMGNEQAAEAAYLRAYAAQKTADGRILLGNLYRDQGRWAEARTMYQSAWDRRRRYMAANASLGDILRRMGHEDEARAAFAGYFVAEQQVTDWSWQHLAPPPTAVIDVGNGLDFGYVGGVYNAEVQQGTTARWTNGQGRVRVAGAQPADGVLVRFRLAAPHTQREQVTAQVCCAGRCQPIVVGRTWRLVTLVIPLDDATAGEVVLHSPTFVAADGREVGMLLDKVWVLETSY